MVQGSKGIRQVVYLPEWGLSPAIYDGEKCKWCCGNNQGVGGVNIDLYQLRHFGGDGEFFLNGRLSNITNGRLSSILMQYTNVCTIII